MAARRALIGVKVDLEAPTMTKEALVDILASTGVYSRDQKTLRAPSRTSIGRWTKTALTTITGKGIHADRSYIEVQAPAAKPAAAPAAAPAKA